MVLLPSQNQAYSSAIYLFGLGFKPVQDDFQHEFARMTDETQSSVDLTRAVGCPLRECNNQRLSPQSRPVSCSRDPVTVKISI